MCYGFENDLSERVFLDLMRSVTSLHGGIKQLLDWSHTANKEEEEEEDLGSFDKDKDKMEERK